MWVYSLQSENRGEKSHLSLLLHYYISSNSWKLSSMLLSQRRPRQQLNLLGAAYAEVNNSISATLGIGTRVGIDSRNVAVVLNHLFSLTAHYSQRESCRNRDKSAHSSFAMSQ